MPLAIVVTGKLAKQLLLCAHIFVLITERYKLFSKMFPGYSVHYFDSSRNMLESATQTENKFFNQYVGKLVDQGKKIDQTIYIDIHGTGKRMVEYFDKHWSNVPFCFLLTAAESSYLTMPKETRRLKDKGRLKVMSYDVRGGPIEMLNYDLIGTCQTYNEKGAVRDKLEYDKELVSVYHECMENLIKTVEPFEDTALSKRLFTESEKKKKYWRYMKRVLREYTDIIQRQKPIVSKKVRHVGVHPRKFRNRKRK